MNNILSMEIKGEIDSIFYHNETNGFTVLQLKQEKDCSLVNCVGTFLNVNKGMFLLIEGEWKSNPRYGRQFSVLSWQEAFPSTLVSLEKYLSSNFIHGVGPESARLIITHFGEQTMDILENNIERLREVRGIGPVRLEAIIKSWKEHHAMKDVMIFLQGHGVSSAYAVKIYNTYGKDSIRRVQENPYALADDISGIGLLIADSIAQKMGCQKDDPNRCKAGLMYSLKQLASDGHTYGERQQVLEMVQDLLDIEVGKINSNIDSLKAVGDIIIDDYTCPGEHIYLPMYYRSEVGVAELLASLMSNDCSSVSVSIDRLSRDRGIHYDEIQKDAILTAAQSKVMVLTGGPGTGKTTTIQGIITVMKEAGLRVVLAAPTGRAAKRMQEATGEMASTIHRLLEYKPDVGFKRNEDNPIKGDVLIVDECSMIDIMLTYSLLKAIPPCMRLILVGDTDQLPSIGAGNVLNSIIASGEIPVVRLTRIFRQAQASQIIMNAHAINKGLFPDLSNRRGTDFFFIEREKPEEVVNEIVKLVSQRLPPYCNLRPTDIQILSPMKKGLMGTEELNRVLQEALNPDGAFIKHFNTIYRVGDKVMQIKNNYDKNVFNGDIGYIKRVDAIWGNLTVNFDGAEVVYSSQDLDELLLAYACTIHKSQGSEFPVVVMPASMSHYIMLQRNLIYTGITRAKRICVIVGSKKAMYTAIANNAVRKRNSLLKERIKDFSNGFM